MEAGMVPMTLVVAAVVGIGGDLHDGVYDFTGQHCPPCREMAGIVSELERNGYPIRKVECEYNQDLVKRFNIRTIPAFVLVINGQEKARINRKASQDELIQLCNRVPRSPDSLDSLGAPAQLPGKAKERRDDDLPAPSATAPKQAAPKQPAPEKSGITWPFGSKKKEEPAGDPQSTAIPRGKADDRPKIDMPVLGNPLAASVRIRLRDSKGESFGSGTIIDSRVGQTIILTCGHIFRNWDKQTKIEVDWFDNGREETMVGKRLYHDLEADLGLIAINADWVPSCRVAPVGTKIVKGTPVVTVGCSGGNKPTVQHVKITELNRYQGADNIEVGGMPVEGRSGGGLFNKDGLVIGVCRGAAPHHKEGYFMGLKTLHDLLDHCQLSRLYRDGSTDENGDVSAESVLAQGESDETVEEDDLGESEQPPATVPPKRNAKQSDTARAQAQSRGVQPTRADAVAQGDIDAALEQAGEAEIVCIIRPINQPGAISRVVILNRASRRFVEYLADELDERPEILETTLQSQEQQPKVRNASSTQKVKRPTNPAKKTASTGDATESASPSETKSSGPKAYRRNRSS
jgi:thiol-disulfide isomerase/thioredoxin